MTTWHENCKSINQSINQSINRIFFVIFVTLVLVLATSCGYNYDIKDFPTPVDLNELGKYTILPDGTDGTKGTSAKYVTFGTYPQTVKDDSVKIFTIYDNLPCEVIKKVGMFTYSLGSDGYWYCEALEEGNGSRKYSNGKVVTKKSEGSYQWFKVEPIKWRVLFSSSNGKKLLFAEMGHREDAVYFKRDANANGVKRMVSGKEIYDNNYKYSMIRAWLNGISYEAVGQGVPYTSKRYNNAGFLQTAFTAAQQNIISSSYLEHSISDPTDADKDFACDDTYDKIFLLSKREIRDSYYGFDTKDTADNSRVRKPTDFALAANITLTNNPTSSDKRYAGYHLGTACAGKIDGSSGVVAYYVSDNGAIVKGSTSGNVLKSVGDPCGTVVPALYMTP